jgi:hypothetical protein
MRQDRPPKKIRDAVEVTQTHQTVTWLAHIAIVMVPLRTFLAACTWLDQLGRNGAAGEPRQ